jgi:5-methylcytosine-specific restriction enzyme subunit McrC
MTVDVPAPTIVELGEWSTSEVIPASLSDDDRLVVAELAAGESRLEVLELRSGVQIRTSSWIGVVRFSEFEVRVVPKYVGGDLGVLRMLDYASGWNALGAVNAVRRLHAQGASLVDLLGRLLADRARVIIRRGLLEDYVARSETLPALRGRLRMLDQVTRRFGVVDRLECEFDELETDILENRVVAAGLGAARRVCREPSIVDDLAAAHDVVRDACSPGAVTSMDRASITYHRRNDHYRDAHALSWLFIDRLAVDDLYASGTIGSFAFLLDMNQLFEDFVTRLLRDALEPAGMRVEAQARSRAIIENAVTRRPYAAVVPDLLLTRRAPTGSTRVPVDAKYKLYDDRKLSSADIYQAFFYAYAFSRRPTDEPPSAILVFPSESGGERTSLRVRSELGAATASVRAVGISVPDALAAIESRTVWTLPEIAALRASFM